MDPVKYAELGRGVDTHEDADVLESGARHSQVSFFSLLKCWPTRVVKGEAKKKPKFQKDSLQLEATDDGYSGDFDAGERLSAKRLHQDGGVAAASRSPSRSGTRFVQVGVGFYVKEVGKEEAHREEPGGKVAKVVKAAIQRVVLLSEPFLKWSKPGEVAVDDADSEPLPHQERPQERRSKSVTRDEFEEGEGIKFLAKEVGKEEAHREETGGKVTNVVKAAIRWVVRQTDLFLNWFMRGKVAVDDAESEPLIHQEHRLNATLAKIPEQDTSDVQGTDNDVVESVPRRIDTAEYFFNDGIAAESIISVNLAGPGQPAELLGGLSVSVVNPVDPYIRDLCASKPDEQKAVTSAGKASEQ